MTAVYTITVDGIDVGPNGERILYTMSDIEVAGTNTIGAATMVLRYPAGSPYAWRRGMRVVIAKQEGGVGFGYLGGVIANIKRKATKGPNAYIFATLQIQDHNVAFDRVFKRASPSVTISAGILTDQVADLTILMQGVGVNWNFDYITYVQNITGATELPAVQVNGRMWRDCMDEIMANAFAADNTLRPGYHAAEMSDGVGGTAPAILVYNKADVTAPDFVIAWDADTGAGEYALREVEDSVNGALLTQKQQAKYGAQTITYTNDDSQEDYPNPYVDDGGTDGTGYWWGKLYKDTDSTSLAQAEAKLAKLVKNKEFPIQTLTAVVDEINVRPGQIITLRVEPLDIESNFVVSTAKASFRTITPEGVARFYATMTITIGRRKRALGDPGEDDEAVPPVGDQIPVPDPPTVTVTKAGLDKTHGYYIIVQIDHPILNETYGGWVRAHPIRGVDKLIPYGEGGGDLSSPVLLPTYVTIPRLAVRSLYELSATVVGANGDSSSFTDPPTEYTINPVPDSVGAGSTIDAYHEDEADGVVSGWLQTSPDPATEVLVVRTEDYTFGGAAAIMLGTGVVTAGGLDFSDADKSGLWAVL